MPVLVKMTKMTKMTLLGFWVLHGEVSVTWVAGVPAALHGQILTMAFHVIVDWGTVFSFAYLGSPTFTK